MFLINSRLGLFTAASSLKEAPLLPKLRGHFAEFLNESSPAHLRILIVPTCVGLRYGHLQTWLEAFLGSVESETSVLYVPSPSQLELMLSGFTYSTPSLLGRTHPSVRIRSEERRVGRTGSTYSAAGAWKIS